MKSFIWPEIETYCKKHSTPESELKQSLKKETYAHTEMPQMQVGHLEGNFLRLLAKGIQAKRILEIGTFTGYSALSLAEGVMPGGEVITCDIDPENTKIAKAHWDKSPVGNLISLKIGPALETIKSLSGPFDLVFIDADKENYLNYWEACLPKVRQGGLIVVDNVLWSGRVLNPEDETDRSICAFNKVASTDPRVEGVMLTVRDGLWVCTKN